ncbi:armadillo-type protein [Mycena latifolia]|nr:armadillo-type protein [Mycena latifolia]
MHHPLTRQPTRDSLRSWWSDRNPLGPNIDLHAAAKPLMRFMYRRDVLAFIAKTRGSPLSQENIEIYSSYLAYKYVSSSTKTTILTELQARVEDDSDADAIGASLVLHLADELLSSPDAEVRRPMCRILAILARRETTGPAILSRNLCPQLVSLLHDTDVEVIKNAVQGLRSLSKWPDGVQAAVDANVLHSLAELLDSPNEEIRASACDMLEELACLPATSTAVLHSLAELLDSPSGKIRAWTCDMLEELARLPATSTAVLELLVLLSFHDNSYVVAGAVKLLNQIAAFPDGAQAIVDANFLENVAQLVDSPLNGVWKGTWELLEHLARQRLTAKAAVTQMLSLLWSENDKVAATAAETLYHTARFREGAQTAVEAAVLDCVPALLQLPNPEVARWTWELLEELGHRAVTERLALRQVVSLLRSGDPQIFQNAARILSHKIKSSEGAQTVVELNLLECLPELVESPNAAIRDWTWDILQHLTHHETTAPAALGQLVSFLRHDNTDGVVSGAVKILSHIATSPEGAQAAVNAGVLTSVIQLLESSATGLKVWTCELLAKLGLHTSTRDAVWQAKPCQALVSLLRDEKHIVVDRAAKVLAILTRSDEGAHAAADAKVLDCMDELLASSDPQICRRACQIIEALANHGTTAPAVLNVNPCIRLTALLRHPDLTVRKSAMAALAQIYEVPGGLAAIAASGFLAVVGHLMRWVDPKVPLKDALQSFV